MPIPPMTSGAAAERRMWSKTGKSTRAREAAEQRQRHSCLAECPQDRRRAPPPRSRRGWLVHRMRRKRRGRRPPTIAVVLGLPLPAPAEGRPLTAALDLSTAAVAAVADSSALTSHVCLPRFEAAPGHDPGP
jgi:hypothetical protein